MRPRPPRLVAAVLVVATALTAGCLRKTSYQQCAQDADCAGAGDGYRCERNHACSFHDDGCPSGQRYHASAGDVAGTCVDVTGSVDAPIDTAMVTPAAGRECVPGIPLPPTYGDGCAAMVDGKEPRCGTELWDDVCVHWAELLCHQACSGMAVVATLSDPLVIRTSDHAVIWKDTAMLGDGAQAAAWGDFDNDGDPDLAVVSETKMRIFENAGWNEATSTLDLKIRFTKDWSGIVPQYPQLNGNDVKWVDYDHDGDLDVAFSGDTGLVLFKNSDGLFEPQDPLIAPRLFDDGGLDNPGLERMAWGDADGDHFPELVVLGFGKVFRYFHNDHGALREVHWNDDVLFGGGVEWCNLDLDPEPELVVSGYSFVRVFDNVGGAPAPTYTRLDDSIGADLACADLDNDGDLDVIVAGHGGVPARVFTHNPNALTGFAETWRDDSATASMTATWSVSVGNLDGDADLDVLVAGNDNNAPMQYQVFDNITTQKNNVRLSGKPIVQVADPATAARSMALAPLMGH